MKVTVLSRLLLLVASISPALHAQSPASDAAKTHRFFVGTDLKVQWEDDIVDVARFDGAKVAVRDADGRLVLLPQTTNLRWERRPKISRAPVTITNLDHHRMYSVGRDPATHWHNIQTTLNDQQSVRQDITTTQYNQLVSDPNAGPNTETMKRLYGVDGGRWADMQVPDHGQYAQDLRGGKFQTGDPLLGNIDNMGKVKEAALDVMLDTNDQALNVPSGDFFQDRIADDKRDQSYDSFELQFDVSSREPIADAYAVIWARILTPDDPEGSSTVFHQRLGKLDASPRRIRVRKAGLPAGFKLTDITVEVCSHGIELGTNLSERSQSLTAGEARGFLLLAHLADHKGETIPAQPVWDLAPAELWAAADGQAFDYPVFVTLDEHGQVLGVHRTEKEARDSLAAVDVSQLRTKATATTLPAMENLIAANAAKSADELSQTDRLPNQIVSLVGRTVFMPALDNGAPIPSYLTVNLADFFR